MMGASPGVEDTALQACNRSAAPGLARDGTGPGGQAGAPPSWAERKYVMSWNESHGAEELDAAAFAADYPTIGPLLMLDASLALTMKFLRHQHPEIDEPDGPKVGEDDPPLPWLAGPILDQMAALRRSIDRYRCAVAQGGSCCYLCPGAGRMASARHLAASGAVR